VAIFDYIRDELTQLRASKLAKRRVGFALGILFLLFILFAPEFTSVRWIANFCRLCAALMGFYPLDDAR
jgi:hypothetical protein